MLDQFRQIRNAPNALARLDLALIEDGHSRAVIAPVFQPPETVEKDGNCLGFTDVADDSAHRVVGVEKVDGERGGVSGDWWKWKVDPYVVDCVMVAAQPGSDMPSASAREFIDNAVPMVLQWPTEVALLATNSMKRS